MTMGGAVAGSFPGQAEDKPAAQMDGAAIPPLGGGDAGAISATHLVKERRGFGQTIRPLPGSVLASTALGSWDPDPDYFFHWLRDSAIVIDALRHVIEEGSAAEEGLSRFKEFVAFSLSLNRLDGSVFLRRVWGFQEKYGSGFSAIRARRRRASRDRGGSCAWRASLQSGRDARHQQMVAPAT